MHDWGFCFVFDDDRLDRLGKLFWLLNNRLYWWQIVVLLRRFGSGFGHCQLVHRLASSIS